MPGAATLTEVVDELRTVNRTTSDTNKNIMAMLEEQKLARLDALEERLERQRAQSRPDPVQSGSSSGGPDKMGGDRVGVKDQLVRLGLKPFAIALAGTIAGFRGWEIAAVKTLNTKLKPGLTSLRSSFTSLATPLEKAKSSFMAFEKSGIGKSVQAMGKTASNATAALGRVIAPIGTLTSAFSSFSIGPVGRLLTGLAKGGLRFLGPIGLVFGSVFSFIDGVKAWKSTEGPLLDKMAAFTRGMVADFVGAPLDMLKGSVTWMVRKGLGLKTDENGMVLPGQGLPGKIVSVVQKFSFEDTINNLAAAQWEFTKGIATWIGDVFRGKKSFGDIVRDVAGVGHWIFDHSPHKFIYNKAIAPALSWIGNVFKGKKSFGDIVKDVAGTARQIIDNSPQQYIYSKAVVPALSWIGKKFGLDWTPSGNFIDDIGAAGQWMLENSPQQYIYSKAVAPALTWISKKFGLDWNPSGDLIDDLGLGVGTVRDFIFNRAIAPALMWIKNMFVTPTLQWFKSKFPDTSANLEESYNKYFADYDSVSHWVRKMTETWFDWLRNKWGDWKNRTLDLDQALNFGQTGFGTINDHQKRVLMAMNIKPQEAGRLADIIPDTRQAPGQSDLDFNRNIYQAAQNRMSAERALAENATDVPSPQGNQTITVAGVGNKNMTQNFTSTSLYAPPNDFYPWWDVFDHTAGVRTTGTPL